MDKKEMSKAFINLALAGGLLFAVISGIVHFNLSPFIWGPILYLLGGGCFLLMMDDIDIDFPDDGVGHNSETNRIYVTGFGLFTLIVWPGFIMFLCAARVVKILAFFSSIILNLLHTFLVDPVTSICSFVRYSITKKRGG